MSTWELPALELLVGWQAFGREMLPNPLRYIGSADSHEEYEQQYRESATQFATAWDEELYRVFVILAQSWARMELTGFREGERDPVLRVHGAVSGIAGAVLVQRRDRDSIHVRRTSAAEVARYVVGRLPAMQAGTQPRLEIPVAELLAHTDDESYQPTSWQDDGRAAPSGAERMRVQSEGRLGGGNIVIAAGPDVSELPVPSRDFVWIDMPDGRYVQWHDERTFTQEPVDETAFAQLLQRVTSRTADQYHRDVSS